MCRMWGKQVGAGGLDANVPTGTVIGLFEEPDDEGCIVDYGIDDANLQVTPDYESKVVVYVVFGVNVVSRAVCMSVESAATVCSHPLTLLQHMDRRPCGSGHRSPGKGASFFAGQPRS